jgi:hypothetical protein
MTSSRAAASPRSARHGCRHERTALAPCAPWHRSPARAAHQRGTRLDSAHRSPHTAGPPQGTSTAKPPPGATAWQYLAPSVCTGAIAHRRLVGLQDRIVTCTDRTPGSPRPRTTRLDVLELMRRFLHHVLPAGVMQVRHCGLMNTHCRITTDPIRQLLPSHTGAPLAPPRDTAPPPAQVTCPPWGAPLLVLSRGWPLHMALFETGEAHALDPSLTVSMRLWQETGDRTAASAARDNALQGPCGQAANGAPSPVWGLTILPTGYHPSPSLPHCASRTPLPLTHYPLDLEAALRGFLEQGIAVTSAGHLYP